MSTRTKTNIDNKGPSSVPLTREKTASEKLRSYTWWLGLCGILSAFFLVFATVLGGLLRDDGYSHIQHSISELNEQGAPNANFLMILFTTYHALVVPFAIGLHLALPRNSSDGWRNGVGPVALGLAGVLGIPLGAYARCDPGCFGATTFRGKLHGILVLVTVPLVFTGIIASSFRVRGHDIWKSFRRYSKITAATGLAFGVGMIPFMQGPKTGLLERISVAIILQWDAITGWILMRGSVLTQLGFKKE